MPVSRRSPPVEARGKSLLAGPLAEYQPGHSYHDEDHGQVPERQAPCPVQLRPHPGTEPGQGACDLLPQKLPSAHEALAAPRRASLNSVSSRDQNSSFCDPSRRPGSGNLSPSGRSPLSERWRSISRARLEAPGTIPCCTASVRLTRTPRGSVIAVTGSCVLTVPSGLTCQFIPV